MSGASQKLWVVAPTEQAAIELAQKHARDRVCRSFMEAVSLQERLEKQGRHWIVWEMAFSYSIIPVKT